MNKISKFLSLTVVLMTVISATFAADNKSTLLLSETKGIYSVDFLNEDAVTALQFDIKFAGANVKSLSLSSCVSGLPASHTGSCAINKNGNVRVVIYSNTNAVLESGSIGSIKINGALASRVAVSKLLMGTSDMKEIQGNILVDINQRKPNLNLIQ